MIIYHGISLILLSVVILLVGLFKPKWILFWMDNPTRVMTTGVSMVIFMAGAVMFGEGNKEKRQAPPAAAGIEKPINDTPVAEATKPVTPPPPPAQAPETSANELRP